MQCFLSRNVREIYGVIRRARKTWETPGEITAGRRWPRRSKFPQSKHVRAFKRNQHRVKCTLSTHYKCAMCLQSFAQPISRKTSLIAFPFFIFREGAGSFSFRARRAFAQPQRRQCRSQTRIRVSPLDAAWRNDKQARIPFPYNFIVFRLARIISRKRNRFFSERQLSLGTFGR